MVFEIIASCKALLTFVTPKLEMSGVSLKMPVQAASSGEALFTRVALESVSSLCFSNTAIFLEQIDRDKTMPNTKQARCNTRVALN